MNAKLTWAAERVFIIFTTMIWAAAKRSSEFQRQTFLGLIRFRLLEIEHGGGDLIGGMRSSRVSPNPYRNAANPAVTLLFQIDHCKRGIVDWNRSACDPTR